MRREQMHTLLDVVLDMGQKLVARPLPPEAGQHFKAARREALLGARALIDAALEPKSEEPTAPATIKID